MASPKRAVQLGPFMKGLNTFSDPSAVPDDGLAELLNMELDLDGSLVSRPPFHDTGIGLPLDPTGSMVLLGLFYTPAGAEYLIASDGLSKTYYLSGGSWALLTNTFAATAMTQFDDKAWLLAPTSSANPGGYWSPSLGFVAEPNMPKGTVIVAFKFRLWVAQGEQATTNGSRLYFSKLLGVSPFWPANPEFIDIARGDGQNIIAIERYYESLLIFRTSSIYRFSYNSDPATGTIEVSVPNIGLASRWAIESHENYFYFFYDDRAYEYFNGRAQVISQAIKFQTSGSRSGFTVPIAVSVFNNRAIFTFYDTLYVFSLVTRTWSRWRAPTRNGVGRVLERRNASLPNPQAYAMSALPPANKTIYTNLFTNPRLVGDGTYAETRRNIFTVPKPVAGPIWDPVGISTAFLGSGSSAYVYGSRSADPDCYFYLDDPNVTVTPGEPLTFAVQVWFGPTATQSAAALYWLDSGGSFVGSEVVPIPLVQAQGPWTYVGGIAPANAVRAVLVIGLAGPAGAEILVGEAFAERTLQERPAFSGYTAQGSIDPDMRQRWLGTPDASESVMEIERVRGVSPNQGIAGVSSYAGKPAIRFIPTGTDDSYFNFTAPVAAQSGGTVLGTVHLAAPLTGTLSTPLVLFAGAPSQVSAPAPNIPGSYPLRFTYSALSSVFAIRWRHGGLVGSGDVWWTDLGLFAGDYDGPAFTGSDPGYKWDGAVDNSTSSTDPTRYAPLLRITDAITSDNEEFQCLVHTKILSMDTPQLYKRLFWWGLDGIFRMEARGTALPIVYGGSVTWGELYDKGITWGQLLFGTWGRPVSQGLSVETIRPDLGATAQRKFTKFMKKLRFRQIQFQVVFNTRGDDQTAPVRLFSLHTEVTPAQTVSKAIS